jgi:hypothetical protein
VALGYFRSHGSPSEFFFEDLVEIDGDTARKNNILEDKEVLDLICRYYAVREDQRKRLFDLARVLSHSA